MAQALYKVIMSGELAENHDKDRVVKELATLFKCSLGHAAKLVTGKPTPLKKEMNHDTATKYHLRLEKVGVKCSIEQILPAPQEPALDSGLSLEKEVEPKPDSTELSLERPIDEPPVSNLLSGTSLSLEPRDNVSSPSDEQSVSQTKSPTAPNIEPGMIICPKCNTKQPKTKQCSKCEIFIEKYLASQVKPSQHVENTVGSVEEEMDEMSEFALFVGDAFDKSYRLRFSEILDSDGKYVMDWNWAAFLMPFPWMIHRKMCLYAAIYFVVNFVVSFALPLVGFIITYLAAGLMGTYLYFQFSKAQISKISSSPIDRDQKIADKGGVISIPLVIGITIATSTLFGIIFSFLFVKANIDGFQKGMANDMPKLHESVDKGDVLNILMLRSTIDLKYALKKSVDETASLPDTVAELKTQYNLSSFSFTDKWDNKVNYKLTESGYMLYTAGPDQALDTEDDVIIESVLEE